MIHNKFLFLLISIIALPFISATAFAINVGGPIETIPAGKFSLSSNYTWVKRDLDLVNDTLPFPYRSRDNLFIAKATYGFSDRFNVYVKLGASDNDVRVPWQTLESEYMFAWGVGLRSQLVKFSDRISLGVDAQYFSHAKHRYLNITDVLRSDIQEYHVGVYLYATFKLLSLYAGGKYSDYNVDFSSTWNFLTSDLDAGDNWGIYFGTDINITDNLKFSIEGSRSDETAIHGGLTYILK